MNFFKLSLKLKGFPIDKAIQELEKYSKNHSESLELRQHIFEYHTNHNSFYNNILNEKQISDWEDIPILTKDMLHAPINERLSETYRNKNILLAKTSGSSGFPFSYAKDKFCHVLTWAHILNIYAEIGIDYGSACQARFYGIPKDGKSKWIEHLKDKLSKRKRLVIFDLTDHKLDEFIGLFQKNKFDYIYGYTSSIVLFAKHLNKKGLKLKDICPSVKVCITTSEMLFPFDRILLEEQFEIPIYNEYGASEFGLIAFENNNRQLILNDKTVYVEILDDKGRVLPDGETGRIVVTSLYNKAHPFIRYEVGDLGTITTDRCTGKRILSELTGRTNEFAILKDGKRIPAFTFYYIAKSISGKLDKIKELKIVQLEKSTFRVEYTASRQLKKEEEYNIKSAFIEYLETQVDLKFEKKSYLERTKSGKLKQFETRL